MSQISLIYTTFENQKSAEDICAQLLNENLIACANIMPQGASLYRWEGQVELNKEEVSALLKTSSVKIAPLKEQFLKLHPYDCPCFVEIATGAGTHQTFADWVAGEVSEK